jgi:hypothetical protein
MADVVNDPFHRALKFALDAQIASNMDALASGSAAPSQDEQVSTAEKYAAAVARIQTFRDVLNLCGMIEKEMLDGGARAAKVEVVER